jgi:hypothetical protein
MTKVSLRLLMVFLLALPVIGYGQSDLVLAPYATSGLYLDVQITNDDPARPADRVYVLQDGIFLLGVNLTNNGYTLRMRAEEGAHPVIFLYPPEGGTFPTHFLQMGGDAWLQGLTICGYVEADTSQRYNNPPRTIRSQTAGFSLTIDGCIITNTRGEHLRFEADMHVVKIVNSVFANQGDENRSNLGAGKPIDFRNVNVDSAIIVNNTFVNFQDRLIRHYRSVGSLKYLLFDHNTAYNSMGFHGTLVLGNVGDEVIITNNIFRDTFISGADTDATRQAEFDESTELDPRNGLGKMFWVTSVPNDSTNWTVANNYYGISPEVQTFYDDFASAGVLGEGPPLTHHINTRLGADSANAWTKTDFTFGNVPLPMVNQARWYRDPEGGNKTKNTPCTDCWDINKDDFDRRVYTYFLDTLDCTYPTGTDAYTGAEGGFPAGDLNWFPERKADWETWVTAIDSKGDPDVAREFSLWQNYPNPFNPVTNITFDLPTADKVQLTVYNMLGQAVTTLVNTNMKAGRHTVAWNATRFASGIYFYTLQYGNLSSTRKMVLMK